jgi:hypothetical protein
MSLRGAVCSFLLSSTLASKIQSSGEVSQRRSSEALVIAITAKEEPQSDTASALTHLLATGTTTSATAGFNAVRQSLCQWYDSEHQIATDNEENMVKACRAKCGLEKVKANGHIQAFTVNKVNDKKAYCTCSSRGDCLDYLSCPNCVSYIMMDKFPWPFSTDSEEPTTTAADKTPEKVHEEPTTATPAAEDKPVKIAPTTAAPAAEDKLFPWPFSSDSEESTTTVADKTTEKAPTTAAPATEEEVKAAPTAAAPAAEEKVKEAPRTAAAAEETEASTTTAPDAEEKTAKATTTEAATTLAETTSVKKESTTDAEASSFVNAETHLRHKKSHKKKHSGKAHHKKHGSKDKKKSL